MGQIPDQAVQATLLGSHRLDEFFHSLLAQLRLAWSESRDDEEFQRCWAGRDRELYELLHAGRRTQAVGTLLRYLEDSEHQVLDGIRRSRGHHSAAAPRGNRPPGHHQRNGGQDEDRRR